MSAKLKYFNSRLVITVAIAIDSAPIDVKRADELSVLNTFNALTAFNVLYVSNAVIYCQLHFTNNFHERKKKEIKKVFLVIDRGRERTFFMVDLRHVESL